MSAFVTKLKKLGLCFIATLLFSHSLLLGQQTEIVYLNDLNPTKNYYASFIPGQQPFLGILILIGGFGETPDDVLIQTDLPKIAAKNGLLTVIPILEDGVYSFGVDDSSQQSLLNIISAVMNRYSVSGLPFYIGGFSIGGSCAIKYAQHAKEKPTAVFAIDPPLDFERLYHKCRRDSARGEPVNQESLYLLGRIAQEFGGTPEKTYENYVRIAPYTASDTAQKAVEKFGHTAIRIYCEPDDEWWKRERGTVSTDLNLVDGKAFIQQLELLGNQNAELVLTENKGYRKPDGIRHPHSWSIVDSNALILWLLRQQISE